MLAHTTLDSPARLPPDVHTYTSTKQPWLELPAGALAVGAYYAPNKTWSAESLKRRDVLNARLDAMVDQKA